MDTPRGSASSPDPLNERGDDSTTTNIPLLSSAARPITRSQRSNSMYSLDPHNRMQPSRFSSPRKQTFHLDVGSGTSPQKIRVTVETEDNASSTASQDLADEDEQFDEKVSRRLFTKPSTPIPSLAPKPVASSSRRRKRSPSPPKTSSPSKQSARKKARLSTTTTTKVPLRGLSDDEEEPEPATAVAATPKPKRGRPRRSGTPKPLSTIVEPSSPIISTAVTSSAAKNNSSPVKRGRKPRAATPKAEEIESSAGDELASVDATPAPSSSPVKRTPRANRVTKAYATNSTAVTSTPSSRTRSRSTASATPKSTAKSTTKRTPKRAASSAFPSSDTDLSASDSRPTKRGRGRPRRQAMVPDEMAAIAENVLEEQEQEKNQNLETIQPLNEARVEEHLQTQEELGVIVGSESTSPDPIMEGSDVTTAHPFYAPTPNTIRKTQMRVAVSPAPTSLSSVDLISVQTPARPAHETAPASAADNEEEHDEKEQAPLTDPAAAATTHVAADVNEESGDDIAQGAPSAEDYFSDDNGFGTYDIPEDFVDSDDAMEPVEPISAPIATSPAPVTGGDAEPQTTDLPTAHTTDVAIEETTDVPEHADEPIAPTPTHMATVADEGEDSEDELASPVVFPGNAIQSPNDAAIFSEDLHATTPRVVPGRAIMSPEPPSSPMMEAPTLTITNVTYTGTLAEEEEQAAEASNASATIDHDVHDDAMETSSPQNDLPSSSPGPQIGHSDQVQPDDRMHFSSVESPFVHEASAVHIRRDAQLAQSELTAPESDGDDGDVDAVLLGSAHDEEVESEAESDAGAPSSNIRDMDTIAQGEDFSIIGVESLQASFQMSHAEMPAMGEMTSRIVNRSLQSIRQGNQASESRDNDGLSYLDFITQSSSTPISDPASASVPASAAMSPRTPTATHSAAALSSPTKQSATGSVNRPTPAPPKSTSPRKKAEPLRELIARKSLYEAHGSAASPRVVTATSAHPSSDLASPVPDKHADNSVNEEYDDSFSEIPESVLEAAVPETTNTPFFSRHQAELTGKITMEPTAVDPSIVPPSEPEHDAEDDVQAAAAKIPANTDAQVDADITSSPPIRFSHSQRAVSEQATQIPRLTQENRTTPVGFQSPHYPVTADSAYLNVPHPPGFRPSLSPIVRAGRALQSVTSDPPTPKESEAFLRSPFRSSVARDTASPAAVQGHDSSSPEPVADEGPIQDQLLREQDAEDEVNNASVADATANPEHDAEAAAAPTEVESDQDSESDINNESVEESEAENEDENDAELATTTPAQQPQPAVTTAQDSPASLPKAAWNLAFAPFTGIKNLVVNGAQVISPRFIGSVPASAAGSVAGSVPSTPGGPHVITPTPAAKVAQASVSPLKRTASQARLDAQPSGSSTQPGPRSIKRIRRMETPSRDSGNDDQSQPGSGNGTNRSWRSFIFREDGIAGSITGFATKLVSRTPTTEDANSAQVQAAATNETESSAKPIEIDSDIEAEQEGVAVDDMDVNIVSVADANADSDNNMIVNNVSLPEHASITAAAPMLMPAVLTSEANSTQYGSDMIESMINDISGEGQDVHTMAGIQMDDQDEQDELALDDDDLPMMTPAIRATPGQAQPNVDESASDFEDDDFDIWAVEAERTTRLATREPQLPSQPQLQPLPQMLPQMSPAMTTPRSAKEIFRSSQRLPAITEVSSSPLRDPRIARLQDQEPTRRRSSRSQEVSLLDQNDSLVDDDQDELQGPVSSVKNSPAPQATGGRLLDNFFSSPRLPPAQVSPTSKHNMEINEENRRRAVEQHLAQERQREERAARKQAKQSSSAKKPTGPTPLRSTRLYIPPSSEPEPHAESSTQPMQQASQRTPDTTTPANDGSSQPGLSQFPERSPKQSATSKIRRRLFEDLEARGIDPATIYRSSSMTRSSPSAGSASGTRPVSPGSANTPSPAPASRPANTPGSASSVVSPAHASDRQSPEAERQKENHRPAASHRGSQSPVAPESSPDNNQPAQSPDLFLAGASPDQGLVDMAAPRRSLLFNFRRPLLPNPGVLRPPTTERRVNSLQFATPKKPTPRAASQLAVQAAASTATTPAAEPLVPPHSLAEHGPQATDQDAGLEEGSDSDADSASYRGMWHPFEAQVEEDQSSSFLTPILGPLPPKTASPTKSSFRPIDKPKTPGRVVEFKNNSFMSAVASARIQEQRERFDAAAVGFAEHFMLDTDNRRPLPVLTDRLATETDVEHVGGDGDVRMWDRKEVPLQTRLNRGYEVDEPLSDLMLADTARISERPPSIPAPWTDGDRATKGHGHFRGLTSDLALSPWQVPEAIVKPYGRQEQVLGRAWDLQDWLELNYVLHCFRIEGQDAFVHRHHLSRRRKNSPIRRMASDRLLHKVVHADNVAMVIKDWHLDIVDAFAVQSGRIWTDQDLVRRLFSLLIGETRHGEFFH